MPGLLDLFGGGFVPMNAQGAQAPMGFMDNLAQNRNSLIGLGLGLMGGTRDDPMGPALRGYQAGAANDQNALYRQYMMKKAAEDKAYREQQDKQAQSNWERSFGLRERELSKSPTTDDIREFQYAKQAGGFDGTFMDWMSRKRAATNDKPPAGYSWVDPGDQSKGLQAIEGGPATKLPAETAGRLGLMQAAKPGLEEAKKYFLDESRPGPMVLSGDEKPSAGGALVGMGKMAIGQATSSFEIGRQRRNIRIAIEAALRTATGAAAPEEEVRRYTDMYAPSIYDDLKTRKQKIEALERFMSSAESVITRGHTKAPASSDNKADPWGIR